MTRWAMEEPSASDRCEYAAEYVGDALRHLHHVSGPVAEEISVALDLVQKRLMTLSHDLGDSDD